MNIYKQIRGFYSLVFSGQYEFRPIHVSLYMFFLNQANRSNWVEWVKVPYDLAMQGGLINSKGTYYKVLSELVDFGVIEYQAGINSLKAPKVKIILLGLDIFDIPTPEKDNSSSSIFGQLSEQLTEQLGEQLTKQLARQLGGQLTEHIDRLITSNNKLNNFKLVIEPIDEKPNDKKVKKTKYLDSVFLSNDEFEKLIEVYKSKECLEIAIEILDSYIGSSGKRYKSHYHVMKKNGWVYDRTIENLKKNGANDTRKTSTTPEKLRAFIDRLN